MHRRVEAYRACAVAFPQPFLACGFEAGIAVLTLCSQSEGSFEMEATAVNGKPVACGIGSVFGAATVSIAIIPVLVAAGASAGFGLT